MRKKWITLEIPQGYDGETPKVYIEDGKILSIFVKLTPVKDGPTEKNHSKTQDNGSKNRKQSFDYKFERNPEGGGYRFKHKSCKRREHSGEHGSGIGLFLKGFINVFGSKK